MPGTYVRVIIHNVGPQIDASLIDTIFEYGVSEQAESGSHGNRGQGLFVARTYMAKMAGTVTARNAANGVEFELIFPIGTVLGNVISTASI